MPTMTSHTDTADGGQDRSLCRLAGAVLVQAIEDLQCGSGRNRGDAVQWIVDNAAGHLSFVSCCHLLGRDPDRVRLSLLRQRIPGVGLPYSAFVSDRICLFSPRQDPAGDSRDLGQPDGHASNVLSAA
jgi:hypothetical protein